MSIVCPLCRQPLLRQPRTWACAQGHSFDVAREGYVNLLMVQQKHSASPGDSAESVRARAEFLHAGHYQPLRDAVVEMLEPLGIGSVLDVGCGEGYYTAALKDVAGEVTGLDIAKPAIQRASKRFPGITWLVGSSALLPFDDGGIDVVTALFTQLYIDEMRRVLAPDGHVLVVTPAADHLWSVREGLFEEVQAHEPDKFLAGFEADFEVVARREVRCELTLTQGTLRQLLAMTPYVWKAKPERRAALEACATTFKTNAAFALMLFRKRA